MPIDAFAAFSARAKNEPPPNLILFGGVVAGGICRVWRGGHSGTGFHEDGAVWFDIHENAEPLQEFHAD